MQAIIVNYSTDPLDVMHAARFAPHFQTTTAEMRQAIAEAPQPRDFYHVLEWRMDLRWTREEQPSSAYREVIAAYVNALPLLEQREADTIISLETNREMNMVGGRPSDCARSAVRSHQLGDLTPESFRKMREHDHR